MSLVLIFLLLAAERFELAGSHQILNINGSEAVHTIRVLFYHNPPDAFANCGGPFPHMKTPSLKCRFPGLCIEILSLLAQHLRLEIKPIVYNTDTLGGYDENKAPYGLLAVLANGTSDTICQLFTRTVTNRDMFAFTRTLFATHSWIAVRRYKEADERMWKLFYPYTPDTWLAIGTMLFAQLLIFSVIYKLLESRLARISTSGSEILWRMFRVQLQQPDGLRFRSISGRFQTVVYGLLQCMLFCSLYQSWIVTSLVSKTREIPFQSLDELIPLIESGRYKFYEMVETSSDIRYTRLRNAIRKYPIEIYQNKSEVMRLVEKGWHVAIVLGGSVLDWEAHHFCDIRFVRGGMPEKALHFAFPRGSSFTALFNDAIGHDGMFMHRKRWKYDEHWKHQRDRHCREYEERKKRRNPLSLVPVVGLCIVLFVGFGFALLAFFTEVIFYNFLCTKRNNKMIVNGNGSSNNNNSRLVQQGHQMMDALKVDTLTAGEFEMAETDGERCSRK